MENNDGHPAGRAGFTAHCPRCRRDEVFIHARLARRRHLILALLTAGAWLPVWFALFILKSLRPWRCRACGWHKPEFRKTTPPLP
jgi:hypothetical protein